MHQELIELAGYISRLKWEDVPDSVYQAAKYRILDTVSCAVGAKADAQLQQIAAVYQSISGVSEAAGIWGSQTRTSVLTAAFLNAMAGHILELDDVHGKSKTHIGTVVIPAAWALAEREGKSGQKLLLAVVCGYEVMARIGAGFGVASHRNRGWHVTSTAGTFGAAAACAKLLDLDEAATVSALGLAGTQSCGLWAFLADGSSNKSLHPARAAASGLEAALLAKAGMTGPAHILSASDGGLYPATSDEYDYGLVSCGLGRGYVIENMDNKPYPCCRSTHCVIDGVLNIRQSKAFEVCDITAVRISTYLVGYKQCGAAKGSKNPESEIEAKFSIPYTAACALIYGAVTGLHFSPEYLHDEAIRSLMGKISVAAREDFTREYPRHWGCEVRIELWDGTVLTEWVKDAAGSVKNPLSKRQMEQKAAGLLQQGGLKDYQRIAADLLRLEEKERLPAICDG